MANAKTWRTAKAMTTSPPCLFSWVRSSTGVPVGARVKCIEIRYDKTLSLARSISALLLQPGLDVLHNHDDIMITYLIFLSPYL